MMNTKRMIVTVVFIAALVVPISAFADHDVDLPINGDFRGAPSGYSPAPGWTLTADGGNARILPTHDRDDFMLELRAEPSRSQSVISELHQLPGNMLKLELKVRGSGKASFGYEAFDASQRTLISADSQTMSLTQYDQERKQYFPLPSQAKYVRIRLTAESGSTAMFHDVDAEVSYNPAVTTAPAPVPAPMPAPTPATISAPTIAPPPAPAPSNVPMHPAPPPHHAYVKPLQDDAHYAYHTLGQDEHFEVSVPVGEDVDFELFENSRGGRRWQLVSYDSSICRVKLEHDYDGHFPNRRYKTEIELKARRRGKTTVVFSNGEKKVTIHFTAL